MLRKILNRAQVLIFAGLFLISKETYSQFTLNGPPTCVYPNSFYTYWLTGPFNSGTTIQWCVTNGVIVDNETEYSCRSGLLLSAVNIRWSNTAGSSGYISVTITNPNQSISQAVDVMNPLTPGTASPASQTITYNTTATAVNTSAATGGWCAGPTYQYEWESTTDFINYSGVLSTAQNYYPTSPLTQTTYYRRKVTETHSGLIDYANYTIYVTPPLQAGSLSPAPQTIPTGTYTYLCGFASGGNCSGNYTYQWQSSANGTSGWSNISGANSSCYNPPTFNTPGTFYYRQVITCGTESVNSAVATITVYQALDAGTISPASLTISSGSSPGQLTGTTPTGGNCSGSYTYLWEYTTDFVNYVFSSTGVTTQNYSPSPLTQTTWYRRKVTCGTDAKYSNYAIITVTCPLQPGTISGTTGPITNGTSPGTLTNSQSPSCGNCGSSYAYQWQKSTDNVTYTDISSQNAATCNPGILYQTTYFKRKVTCGSEVVYSNIHTVTVALPLNAGTISGNAATITNGTVPSPLTNQTLASNGNCGSSYSYLWEYSTDGTNYSSTGVTTTGYSPAALFQTTHYRRKVTCSSEIQYSNVFTIPVALPLNGGAITGFTGSIPSGSSPGTYSNQTQATNGNCGSSYSYLWEYSTDGGSNYSSTGVTSYASYTAGNLTANTLFRRKVTCGSETAYSNVISVTIASFSGGTISGNTGPITNNTSPGTITNTASASGCGGTYAYQWEQSINAGSTYTDISSATGLTYTPGNLTVTTYYRRRVTCNAATVYSNTIIVNVAPPLTPGSITAGSTTISNNTSPGQINNVISPTGGNCSGSYNYQWQQSTGGTFSDISNATSSSYTPGSLLYSASPVYYFRRKVSCSSETVYSNIDTINIAPPLLPGSITGGSTTISNSTSPGQINNITSATGGYCGSYTYQWQQSTGGAFADIIDATFITYTPDSLFTSVSTVYYFRRKVSCGTETAFSNIDTINMAPPLLPGSITGGNITILNNSTPSQINSITTPAGGLCGSYTYQWQESTGGVFADISDATLSTYTPDNLFYEVSPVHYFRRKVICNFETAYSNVDTINIVPVLSPGSIEDVSGSIMAGNSAPTINSIASATNGICGEYYNYQWQKSIDNGESYPDIVGATGPSYSPGVLWVTTSFRRKVICSAEFQFSNIVTHNVVSSLDAGVISSSATSIPNNTSPGTFSSVSGASGGVCGPTYTYQWQYSNDGVTYFNVSPNGNNITYLPGNLTQNTYFRRAVICNMETKYSNVIVIVIAQLNPGTVTPSSITIASGTTAGLLTGNAPSGGICGNACGGGGSYTYQWQSSTDGLVWTNISGATLQNYDPGTLTASKYYRRKVSCNGEDRYTNVSYISVGTLITDMNYIRERNIVKSNVTTLTAADALTSVNDVMQGTQYFDGLGRLIQTVSKQSSPLQKDVVMPVVYNEFGRERIKYLPYVSSGTDGTYKPNAIPEQRAFNASIFTTDQFFYGQTDFEASPMNRVMSNFAQGNSWVGTSRGISNQYLVNTATENVKIWYIDLDPGSLPYSAGTYPDGELYKNESVDEHCKKVIEYKDKSGMLILKKVQLSSTPSIDHTGWLCTYYIYDNLNTLRFVLQPKAVELINSNWTVTQSIADELCFRYEYDYKNRLINKKVPGAGEVWMIYDARDRLIMTQDANMRNSNTWMVSKYDLLNRPMETGLWVSAVDVNVHRSNASTSILYPVTSSGYELLSETHYDDYVSLPTAGGMSSTLNSTSINSSNFITTYNTSPLYAQQITQSFAVNGKVTWSKVKVLGSTNTFIVSATIYDDRGRVIQVQTINQTGGLDIVTTQYDFSGKVLRTHQKTQKLNNTVHNFEVLSSLEYDHAGRMKKIKKKLTNNGIVYTEKTIAENTYDELGQLKTKKLAAEFNSNAGLETENFDYNVRGWMLGMNKSYLSSQGQSGTTKFGFELGYDLLNNTSTRNFTAAQYNGNINGMVWKSDGDDVRRKYDFSYDAVNRFMKGVFEQDNGTSTWNNTVMNYTVQMGNGTDPLTAYDANGNIKAMTQYGWKLGVSTTTPIDNLSYNYTLNSNKLLNVIDANNDPTTKLGDFRTSTLHPNQSKTTTTVDYTYDVNGNLKKDLNKDIGTATQDNDIVYNHLNLPTSITVRTTGGVVKGTIAYTYDASGNKLEKRTTEGTALTVTTYLGGAVYEAKGTVSVPGADALQFISHEEGRIRVDVANTTTPNPFDYFIKDHLGNVRMVLTDEYKQDVYPAATLENVTFNGGMAISKEDDYYAIDETKIVPQSVPPNITAYPNNNGNPPYNTINPYSNTTANSARLYQLNSTTNKTGLGIVLKVMAGDQVNIFAKSYHKKPTGPGYNNSIIGLTVTEILNALTGTSLINGKATTAQISGQAGFPTTLNGLIGNQQNQTSSVPKASIDWIILDEQFKYVSGGFDMVGASGTVKSHNLSTIPTISIPKNGYIYVYCANESQYNVFFDNLQLIHTRGPILEETHYYPFGLTMNGISSKALNFGEPKNKEKTFQGQKFDDELGLNWIQFRYRNHDPQIGRFIEIDPLAEKFPYNSTYAFSENKVTGHVELEGLEAVESNWLWDIFFNFSNHVDRSVGATARLSTGTSGEGKVEHMPGPVKGTVKLIETLKDVNTAIAPYVDLYNGINTAASFLPVGEAGLMVEGGNMVFKAMAKTSGILARAIEESGSGIGVNSLTLRAQGNVDKFIVIGRSMDDRIFPLVEVLKKKGLNVETFTANKNLTEAQNLINNNKWITSRLKNGYSVIDAGLDPKFIADGKYELGQFYGMETSVSNGWHFNGYTELTKPSFIAPVGPKSVEIKTVSDKKAF